MSQFKTASTADSPSQLKVFCEYMLFAIVYYNMY